MEIVVLGNKDEILGFNLAGIRTKEINDENFTEVIENLFKDENIGIIVIVDRYFERFNKEFSKKISKKAIPAVVFIPSFDGIHMKKSLREFLSNVLGVRF